MTREELSPVERARIDKQWSPARLAEIADVHVRQIQRIEARAVRRPNLRTLQSIANALGIKASDIATDLAAHNVKEPA